MKKTRINIDQIKKLVLIGLVSVDEMMDKLVLKGGNALSIGYNLSSRASWDLDFSLSAEFEDIDEIKRRMHDSIFESFKQSGYYVFDFNFFLRPKKPNDLTNAFWGGYLVEFKFIELAMANEISGKNIDLLRHSAIPFVPGGSTKIVIDISKFEYTGDIREIEIDGYKLNIYAPRLLAFEKVRAICQQMPEYSEIVPSFTPRPRPKDFYDICSLIENFSIDLISEESKDIMKKVFDAKRVPYEFLKRINSNYLIHKDMFQSVVDTVSVDEKKNIKEFEFYVEYVVKRFSDFLD